jgi:hypothetical protein
MARTAGATDLVWDRVRVFGNDVWVERDREGPGQATGRKPLVTTARLCAFENAERVPKVGNPRTTVPRPNRQPARQT